MVNAESKRIRPAEVAKRLTRGPWLVVHTAFVISLTWLLVLGDYEDRVYQRVVEHALAGDATTPEQQVEAILRVVHDLVAPRAKVWGGIAGGGIKETLLPSGDSHLLAPTLACGSYTHVLARSLQTAGFDIRLAQMKAKGRFGAHILLEAQVEASPPRWVVLDGLYALSFRRPDGKLASFADVKAASPKYESQVPEYYDRDFQYEDVRYTNWSKIPIIMPLARSILGLSIGEETASTLSIRSYVLNIYTTYATLLCAGYGAALGVALLWWWRQAVRQRATARDISPARPLSSGR